MYCKIYFSLLFTFLFHGNFYFNRKDFNLFTHIYISNQQKIHLKQLKLINGVMCDQMCLGTQVQYSLKHFLLVYFSAITTSSIKKAVSAFLSIFHAQSLRLQNNFRMSSRNFRGKWNKIDLVISIILTWCPYFTRGLVNQPTPSYF